ncbi:MAG: ABC transporter ATP-binding protein [bacterium]|nr:ABC transporter ATP-binding protein [bacterium]
MIKLKDVSKYYYNKGLITSGITKINAEFNIGEFIVITGESGSGKSTLLNVISGLDTYEDGEMYIEGKETSHYGEEDFENYRQKYISNIFQNFNLVGSYTVYQNIELVMLINGYTKKEAKPKILKLISEVELTRYKNTKVSKLSGGQKQRVAIARALAKNTPIIIADEPTGNLDKRAAESVLKTLAETAKDKLVIVVTHNYEQVEKYATRKITMFDGKILEDKVIVKTEAGKIDGALESKKMRGLSKLRLGVRNTFNIVPKFLLLLTVFLFMFAAITTEIAGLKENKYEEGRVGYNSYLENKDTNRIIINKSDKSPFTDDDYQKLESLNNISKIQKEDYLEDLNANLYSEYYYLSGRVIKRTDTTPDLGRTIENDNEIVIQIHKENNTIGDPEKILNKDFMYDYRDSDAKLKIVGIIYNDDLDYEAIIEVSENMIDEFVLDYIANHTSQTLTVNGTDTYCNLAYIDNVADGSIYINENLNNNNYPIKTISLSLSNTYVNKTFDLKVDHVLNKNNAKKLTGYAYEDYTCYLSKNLIRNTLMNDKYQTSIFVKDEVKIDDTIKDLKNLGYSTYAVKDMLINESATMTYIYNIINLVLMIIILVVMFFISYLIIKLILKSRKNYYTIVRILGGSKKNCKSILKIELYTILNIAFIIIIGLIYMIINGMIDISLKNSLKLLNLREYVLIYILIFALTYLISVRFGRFIFKESAIKTYNEEEE